MLIDLHWFAPSTVEYETVVTPDQTIGVAMSGRFDLDIHLNGRWHSSMHHAGSIGMGHGGEVIRAKKTIAPNEMAACALVYLPGEQLLSASEHFRRTAQPLPETGFNAVVDRDPGISQMVINLTQAMRRGADDLYAETAAAWLAVHLVSRHGDGAGIDDVRSPGVIQDSRLARVIEMMMARFSEPLALDELAGEACISKFHFARLFRRQVGSTPLGFLTNIRMDTAKRLLLTTDLTIGEVATACGYATAVNFTAAFTARHGVSPSAFRSDARGDRRR
jgi:AraC family transcriptional regulator